MDNKGLPVLLPSHLHAGGSFSTCSVRRRLVICYLLVPIDFLCLRLLEPGVQRTDCAIYASHLAPIIR